MYRSGDDWHHMDLVANPYIHELILNATLNDDWLKFQGRYIAKAPYVEILKNDTHPFVIHENIRGWTGIPKNLRI